MTWALVASSTVVAAIAASIFPISAGHWLANAGLERAVSPARVRRNFLIAKVLATNAPSCSRRPGTISREAGAGEGNRTLVVSLGSFCSAIELHPPVPAPYPAASGTEVRR